MFAVEGDLAHGKKHADDGEQCREKEGFIVRLLILRCWLI